MPKEGQGLQVVVDAVENPSAAAGDGSTRGALKKAADDSTANTEMQEVIGSKADAAVGTVGATASLVAYVKGILEAGILASGTFTTSSATVPADTSRSEADNYWDGCWLIPITGDAAQQPRQIAAYANSGNVFTMDSDHPFTTAPGTVAYVIVGSGSNLVPAADSTGNQTSEQVVGNKTDAAAAGVVTGTESHMAYAKQGINLATGLGGLENSRLGTRVQKSAADLMDGTLQGLFTVAGGRVLMTMISVEVSGATVDAEATNCKFVSNPTVGTDYDMCATIDTTGDEVGTIYSIAGEPAAVMTGGNGGGAAAQANPVIVPEGVISFSSDNDAGGAGALLAAECWYIPLDPGATVVAV